MMGRGMVWDVRCNLVLTNQIGPYFFDQIKCMGLTLHGHLLDSRGRE